MAENTSIEWCDATFNPWIGCTRVSLACDDCYAARSTPARALGVTWGPHEPRRRTSDDNWKLPGQWNAKAAREGRRLRVFCASLADVFDNEVPTGWRVDLLRLIEATPNLDWLLLTKRIGNVERLLDEAAGLMPEVMRWPLPNVWLGATVVNQLEADRDVPKLLALPARVRFLSIEPMLGPIDLRLMQRAPLWCGDGPHAVERSDAARGLHWVIAGGESGSHARPAQIEWFRSLRQQCQAAGVAFHMKQLGEQPRGWCAAKVHVDPTDREEAACDFYEAHECREPCPGRCAALVDRKGGDMAEWPEDLRVREFPHANP